MTKYLRLIERKIKICNCMAICFLLLGLVFTTNGEEKPSNTWQYGNIGKGTGGNYSIDIKIEKSPDSTTNDSIKVCLYSSDSATPKYSKPIISLLSSPSEKNFKITKLPKGTFDIIIKKEGFFSHKISNIKIKQDSSNSTVLRVIPNLSSLKERYLPNEITVVFKKGISGIKGREIISKAGCIVKGDEYREGVGCQYRIIIPDNSSVPQMIDYFNQISSVCFTDPVLLAHFNLMPNPPPPPNTWQYGNIGKGTGGDCTIEMEISGITDKKTSEAIDSLQVYLYSGNNYSQPIVLLSTDSTAGKKFKIEKLPEGTFDIILRKKGFISRKIPDIKLSRLNPSYLESTTLSNIKRAGVINRFMICFKEETTEQNRNEILARSRYIFYDTLSLGKEEKLVFFFASVQDSEKIADVIEYFIQFPSIKYADPDYPGHGGEPIIKTK
ncbi:MAG: hypothetical protein PHX21_02115 [bacterium]|nr:hypothetical protein [bacterium]